MNTLDILIVEDEPFQREMLSDFLNREGHRITEAGNGEEALRVLTSSSFDLVLLDFRMPGMNGLEVLQEVKRVNPEIDVMIITAFGTIETAVSAMKAGARDYITKPVDLDELSIVINRTADHRRLIKENQILRQEMKARGVTADAIRYKSRKMAELINLAGRIASSQATVLIQGETGTGKELFARLIHSLSPRAEHPLITVNCAAIPETLIESELFGHEKGAFTGAMQRRIGRCEQADGGTLFLDEIGELSLPVQVKLLRFLQERELQRVGGERTFKADVRIISATHQDLAARVKEGTFREDLFYRINVVTIKIPPLRERREDIPLLIDHFVGRFARENSRKIDGVSREARDLLIRYDYPGNVRELENIIERAVVISRGSLLGLEDLPFQEALCTDDAITIGQQAREASLQQAIESLERQLIGEALERAAFNQTQAAKLLGLSERMLRYKLKKYGLK
ncbi:sigma-54-dependent transcriptional regulator [Desulfoferrobacter suflitae]|uniref:sigma-54-dependent transcriptional regulator n=1 Tax=Desulfoferrobacter suflitae TaxID=2865782 RepID=UPI002164783D|nr:sigma-54 dependent transcriptional regulator [Desulfoferrobacter suflitae]MCK8603676.1 sigma-54 dependent transcriptional regulator [Desulfoferrobacter suflitae]